MPALLGYRDQRIALLEGELATLRQRFDEVCNILSLRRRVEQDLIRQLMNERSREPRGPSSSGGNCWCSCGVGADIFYDRLTWCERYDWCHLDETPRRM